MGSGIRVRRQGDYGVSRRDTPCRIAVGSGRHDDGTKLAFDEQDSRQNTPLALPGKREDEKTKTKSKQQQKPPVNQILVGKTGCCMRSTLEDTTNGQQTNVRMHARMHARPNTPAATTCQRSNEHNKTHHDISSTGEEAVIHNALYTDQIAGNPIAGDGADWTTGRGPDYRGSNRGSLSTID